MFREAGNALALFLLVDAATNRSQAFDFVQAAPLLSPAQQQHQQQQQRQEEDDAAAVTAAASSPSPPAGRAKFTSVFAAALAPVEGMGEAAAAAERLQVRKAFKLYKFINLYLPTCTVPSISVSHK